MAADYEIELKIVQERSESLSKTNPHNPGLTHLVLLFVGTFDTFEVFWNISD
jgi:hypothetical protein